MIIVFQKMLFCLYFDLIDPFVCMGHNISLISIYNTEFSIPKEMSLYRVLGVGIQSRSVHEYIGYFQ